MRRVRETCSVRPLRGPLLLVIAAASLALLQPSPSSSQAAEPLGPQWDVELGVLGVNALLGGITAVVVNGNEHPPLRVFADGVLGGALVHAGKRVAVEGWFGAGLVGRQVALTGASVVNNAGTGRRAFERIALGAGPIRGYVDTGTGDVRWSLDVPAGLAVAWGLLGPGTALDPMESLSSGAVVFTGGANALTGTIFYPREPGERQDYVLAHERVHVLQYDQAFLFWGDPFEDWLSTRHATLKRPLDHLDFDFIGLGAALVLGNFVWPRHRDQPWEIEAMHFGRTRR